MTLEESQEKRELSGWAERPLPRKAPSANSIHLQLSVKASRLLSLGSWRRSCQASGARDAPTPQGSGWGGSRSTVGNLEGGGLKRPELPKGPIQEGGRASLGGGSHRSDSSLGTDLAAWGLPFYQGCSPRVEEGGSSKDPPFSCPWPPGGKSITGALAGSRGAAK